MPAAQGGGEAYGGEEVSGETIVSRGNPAEIPDACEHAFDRVAIAIVNGGRKAGHGAAAWCGC